MKEICEKGALALTLGGDHSLAMGTISGSTSVYENVGVIWVDAHAVGFESNCFLFLFLLLLLLGHC